MPAIAPPTPPYVGPPKWHGGRGNKPIRRIVIHCTAGAEPGQHNAARNTAAYTKSTARPSSWHYCADAEESIQLTYDSVVAYHDGTNDHSIGYELCCSLSNQGLGHWRRADHQAMLRIAAADVARLCLAYDIPIRRIGKRKIRAGEDGICGHNDMRLAFPGSTSHWDPGPFFPWRRFIRMVREEAAKLTNEGDWFDMATKDELREVVREELNRVVGDVVDVPQNEIDAGVGRPGNDKVAVRTALTRIMRNTRDILNGERPAGK